MINIAFEFDALLRQTWSPLRLRRCWSAISGRPFFNAAATLTILLLVGCSGGTSGTGGGGPNPPNPGPVMNTINGIANKGPFDTTATVTARTLAGGSVGTANVTDRLGRFSITVSGTDAVVLNVTGQYFSEATGTTTTSPLTLTAIADPTSETAINVNVLTHLIAPRMEALIGNGTTVAAARNAATDELLAGLQPAVITPTQRPAVEALSVLSVLQDSPDADGNAFLLALSSILELAADNRAADSARAVTNELADLMSALANDLAADGTIVQDANTQDLTAAATRLDPDRIVANLFGLDEVRRLVLDNAQSEPLPTDAVCAVSGQTLQCDSLAGDVRLGSLLADAGRFIDTDGDGTVNSLDVDDDDDGIIDSEDPEPLNDQLPTVDAAARLRAPASDAAMASYLKRGMRQWAGVDTQAAEVVTRFVGVTEGVATDAGAPISAPPAPLDSQGDAAGTPFSDLNIQIDGVDEANRSRFDGDVLYLANAQNVHLLSASDDPASTTSVGLIEGDDQGFINGMYVIRDNDDSKRLVTLASEAVFTVWSDALVAPWIWDNRSTRVRLYDVTDPANPTASGAISIDGNLVHSRRIGRHLFVVTRFSPHLPELVQYASNDEERAANRALIEAAELSDLLPKFTAQNGERRALVTANDCLLPEVVDDGIYYSTLVSIARVNLDNPDEIDAVCMAENVYGIHVSQQSLYLTSTAWEFDAEPAAWSQHTTVHKFAFAEDGPQYRGSGAVPGYFNGDPAFFMGEHDGRLAVITTEGAELVHRVTLLAESATSQVLEQVGQIPNDAAPAPIGKEGESIFAARVIGNRAYVVTFRQVDPVYVIDLDPLTVLGELEIEGFSTYLHLVSDTLLLGIGNEVEVEDEFPWIQGLKLQLFDISDPTHPISAAALTIGQRGTYSPVLYDPHALAYLADAATGIDRIGFPATVADGEPFNREQGASAFYPHAYTGLHLISIDKVNPGFTLDGVLQREPTNSCGSAERAFFHGGAVHYQAEGNVISAPLENLGERSVTSYAPAEDCFFLPFPGVFEGDPATEPAG